MSKNPDQWLRWLDEIIEEEQDEDTDSQTLQLALAEDDNTVSITEGR